MLSIEEQRQGITSNFSETMKEIRVERNIFSVERSPLSRNRGDVKIKDYNLCSVMGQRKKYLAVT